MNTVFIPGLPASIVSRLARLWLLVLVGLAVSGPAVLFAGAQPATPTPAIDTNETTVQHVNPDESDGAGDLEAVQSSLARRMAGRLVDSSIQLSQGQYAAADELIGEAYQNQYGKYVDVAGETDEEGQSETFASAQQNQQQLTNDVQTYRETLTEYRDARRAGDEDRARQLARELEQITANISTTRMALLASYQAIASDTGADLTSGTQALNQTVTNITTTQAVVREETFTETRLAVTAESATASFVEPLVLTGTLVTEDETPLADRRIRVSIGDRTFQTMTDADGNFRTSYRPVTRPAGDAVITLRYLPATQSPYLGADASVSTTIEQVAPSFQLEPVADTVGYAAPVRVAGQVTAAGTPVDALPVVVTVGGQQVARGTTTDGRFTLSGPLPAGVAVGSMPVRVRVSLENRAIAGRSVSRSIQVRETATLLAVNATATETTMTVNGRFTTTAGVAISGQELTLLRNGSVVQTVRTNADGTYTAELPGDPAATYRVRVQYKDTTTNLAATNATAVVTLPPATGEGTGGTGPPSTVGQLRAVVSDRPLLALLGTVIVVPLAVCAAWLWRRSDTAVSADPTPDPTVVTPSSSPDTDEPDTPGLSAARSALPEDADLAIERGYSRVRHHLQQTGYGSPTATHWEFYEACVAADLDNAAALEQLTQLYEQAAFSPTGVDEAAAETALAAATDLLQ